MEWNTFKRLNTIVGWVVFVLSSIVYLMTIGPSASLWDCPEFILSSHALEVGHPPGAPFFMLVYNLASHLTSDPMKVGLMCNITSALLSAATIMLLFWTITHMVRRLIAPGVRLGKRKDGEKVSLSWEQSLLILGAGLVGSLVYTFTDTFWYSAVEAEVYAFSSFFTALVFWLIFLWEDRSESEFSDRWIILIAYFMGLSIGVHLLNLLCIPAIALVFYFRKYEKPTLKGGIIALLVSFVLIVVMMYGIIQGAMKVGATFDKFAVNFLSLPINSGFYFYLILLVGVLILSVYLFEKKASRKLSVISFLASFILVGIPFIGSSWLVAIAIIAGLAYWLLTSKKLNLALLQTIQMCIVVIMIGFSSYGVILVRSMAGTPMNQNAPDKALSLKRYLNREQYASYPLFYGNNFTARPIAVDPDNKKSVWGVVPSENKEEKEKYVELYSIPEYIYPEGTKTLFPRMWSPDHASSYNAKIGRNPEDMSQPSFFDNLYYLFTYQINEMYWRYFGWNFIGRQNDLPGDGGMLNGNVVTGISFVDSFFLGVGDNMPQSWKENKGYNVYYMLPFLLGLLGIAFQFSRGKRGAQSFWVTFWLFVMTGLAIIFYINQHPNQPRERDYAYAASFYAFAIWIGFGVVGLYDILSKLPVSRKIVSVAVVGLSLIVPVQMAFQNWDDHDRSGRRLASDFGYNYLETCEPNAILFCNGDNDTFPLWYTQTVEGVRRDIKIVNQSYIQSEWYADQMRMHEYDAKPIPFKYLVPSYYYYNVYASIQPQVASMDFDQAMKAVTSPMAPNQGVMPTDRLMLPVDTTLSIPGAKHLKFDRRPYMEISLQNKQAITRDALAVLDMIGGNRDWKRPIYWVSSMPTDAFSNLESHLSWQGMAKRLYPWATRSTEAYMDVDKMYDNVMNKYRYFNADRDNIYFDENIRKNINYYYRNLLFAGLANELIARGDTIRAKAVMEKCRKTFSSKAVPYSTMDISLIEAYYQCGLTAYADEVAGYLLRDAIEQLDWFWSLSTRLQERALSEQIPEYALQQLLVVQQLTDKYASGVAKPYKDKIQYFLSRFGMASR